MFCVQYVNDHSRKFLSAYEEHYIFSLSVLGNRFLPLLYPYYVLIMSLLFPTFVLFPISACSFFQLSHALKTFTFILQLVPF